LVESSGLLSTTWVIGWYFYHLWMGFCGFFYQYLGSFFEALGGKDYRNTLTDDTVCMNYIQAFI